MNGILLNADTIYNRENCCHKDGRFCNRYNCLRDGFYDGEESYDCLKKLSYYVLNYGPSYSSEIYHFLNHSKILENSFQGNINVLSLGCGFGPDWFALDRYIHRNNLPLAVNYMGIDKEPRWLEITNGILPNIFYVADLLDGFNISGYQLIFLNKLFSTLLKHGLADQFMYIFLEEIKSHMADGAIIVFDDVNSNTKGRDNFNTKLSTVTQYAGKYFFNVEGAYTGAYNEIPYTVNVYQIPDNLSVTPKTTVNKTVFFVYKKQ